MVIHSRLVRILGSAAALLIAGCAGTGGVTPSSGPSTGIGPHGALFAASGWVQKDGVLFHKPHYMVTLKLAKRRSATSSSIVVTYDGGPALVTPVVYLTFWGYKKYGDSDNLEPLLETYLKNMGGSSHNNIYTQYYEVSAGKNVYITNPSSQYGGAWEDNKDAVPSSPTDPQIAAEALKAVAHFGYSANASYVIATPHGRSTFGFAMQWCGYHSVVTTAKGKLVSYTNLPYVPDGGTTCGAGIVTAPTDESAADEGATIVEGHEEGESVTDLQTPDGWYNFLYGEIGDICAWQNIQNDPFNGYSFTMQPMYSNATESCVHSY